MSLTTLAYSALNGVICKLSLANYWMETHKIDDIGNGNFDNFAYIFTLHR